MQLSALIPLALNAVVSILVFAASLHGAEETDTSRGDRMLEAYFRSETKKLAAASLADVKTWDDWTSRRDTYRQQLREMLGLDPLPERTPLNAVVTGTLERDDFKVEKLHFQSRPHLFVTGNLYLPKKQNGNVPAVLYVCGHSASKKNGVNFGNKAKYQHHGAWLARNGYVCLVIDTLQMGEIEGLHHGTFRESMWWWNARGYTPAGVEAWNSIRAIDYLVSRPEVDPERIGMTGRSGGGAYSWYAAALDDRIKAVVPVAGITTLENHIVDGCVERHCDCMYMVNTYRWDYPQLAALAAPRPLLISNTDRDELFPFMGVVDVYRKVRHLYELNHKGDDVALQMAAGPHHDLQVLQLYALQWFNQHLKGQNALIESAAKDYFKPEELKVFDKLPADQINTQVQETFVPQAAAPLFPSSQDEWQAQREKWLAALREKCFRGWPSKPNETAIRESPHTLDLFGGTAYAYGYKSDNQFTLPIYLAETDDVPRKNVKQLIVTVLDRETWTKSHERKQKAPDNGDKTQSKSPSSKANRWTETIRDPTKVFAYVPPRGIGPTAWDQDAKEQTHIRRRFMLLGQTLDGMRVWDVRRAIQSLRELDGLADVPIVLTGSNEMAGVALYAALFEPNIEAVVLTNLPKSHREGPDFLNVMRYLDIPQAVAMVAEKSFVVINDDATTGWEYPLAVDKQLGWGQISIDNPSKFPKRKANVSPE